MDYKPKITKLFGCNLFVITNACTIYFFLFLRSFYIVPRITMCVKTIVLYYGFIYSGYRICFKNAINKILIAVLIPLSHTFHEIFHLSEAKKNFEQKINLYNNTSCGMNYLRNRNY